MRRKSIGLPSSLWLPAPDPRRCWRGARTSKNSGIEDFAVWHPVNIDWPWAVAAPEHGHATRAPGLDPGVIPVRVKKTRQNKKTEPRSNSIGTEKALDLGDASGTSRHRTRRFRCHPGRHAGGARFVSGLCQDLACRLRRRADLDPARHCRAASLDDGGGIQRDLCAVPFPARAQRGEPLAGVRIAVSRSCRRDRGVCRPARAADDHRDHPGRALQPFRRNPGLAAHAGRGVLRGGRAVALGDGAG